MKDFILKIFCVMMLIGLIVAFGGAILDMFSINIIAGLYFLFLTLTIIIML